MKNKALQTGFTLIEVAIVVAVIMFLALFVYPPCSNYFKKAQVTEALELASTAKIAVNHYVVDHVPLTSAWTPPVATDAVQDIIIYLADGKGISLSSHGELISMPVHQSGEIVIVFSSKIAPVDHNRLILSPRRPDPTQASADGHELPLDVASYSSNSLIIWECNSANPPLANRGTRGNLDAKLVPDDCRA